MDLSGREHRSPCGEDVAPYALGALSPAEARRFEDHLAGCDLCRTDLARLRPVVDALPEMPEQVEPPARLRHELMAVVEAEAARRRRANEPEPRRRWVPRLVPALAAACVLAVAGIGIGVVASGGGAEKVPGIAPNGAQAALTVEGDRGEIELHGMPSPPSGRVMQVWLMREGSSSPEPTDALFTPNASGDAHVTVPGDMDGVRRVLISDEPAGGSKAPTTTPSVDFRLS
jgi:anti-sigma-K factor RskA